MRRVRGRSAFDELNQFIGLTNPMPEINILWNDVMIIGMEMCVVNVHNVAAN